MSGLITELSLARHLKDVKKINDNLKLAQICSLSMGIVFVSVGKSLVNLTKTVFDVLMVSNAQIDRHKLYLRKEITRKSPV